jgi:hypothetical protein
MRAAKQVMFSIWRFLRSEKAEGKSFSDAIIIDGMR